jgi:hypothetical protein
MGRGSSFRNFGDAILHKNASGFRKRKRNNARIMPDKSRIVEPMGKEVTRSQPIGK